MADTTIDFETGAPPVFVATSPLTTAYSGLGVTFSGVDGDGGSILDQAGSFGIAARSGSDFLAFNDQVGSGLTELVSFAGTITSFNIYVGDGTAATYTATAFDQNNQVLATATATPGGGTYGNLVLNAAGITHVTFSEVGSDGYVADDLTFGGFQGGVPEPAAWALMIGGFGLAGVSLRRRRSAVA